MGESVASVPKPWSSGWVSVKPANVLYVLRGLSAALSLFSTLVPRLMIVPMGVSSSTSTSSSSLTVRVMPRPKSPPVVDWMSWGLLFSLRWPRAVMTGSNVPSACVTRACATAGAYFSTRTA